jgi:hypothetical protein
MRADNCLFQHNLRHEHPVGLAKTLSPSAAISPLAELSLRQRDLACPGDARGGGKRPDIIGHPLATDRVLGRCPTIQENLKSLDEDVAQTAIAPPVKAAEMMIAVAIEDEPGEDTHNLIAALATTAISQVLASV